MRLRLSKRFFAALMAAIASVTFTSAGTATLGAAAFTFSMQQAAAAEQIDTTASSNTDTAVSMEASGDKKASDDEESEEVEAEEELLEPDSTPIASVGSGGAAGSGAAGYSQGGAENVGNLDNAPQQQAGAQSVSPSASLPSDDLGFTTNAYAGSIAEALVDVAAPSVPAAIASELKLTTPAKSTSSGSSSSSSDDYSSVADASTVSGSAWNASYDSHISAPAFRSLSSKAPSNFVAANGTGSSLVIATPAGDSVPLLGATEPPAGWIFSFNDGVETRYFTEPLPVYDLRVAEGYTEGVITFNPDYSTTLPVQGAFVMTGEKFTIDTNGVSVAFDQPMGNYGTAFTVRDSSAGKQGKIIANGAAAFKSLYVESGAMEINSQIGVLEQLRVGGADAIITLNENGRLLLTQQVECGGGTINLYGTVDASNLPPAVAAQIGITFVDLDGNTSTSGFLGAGTWNLGKDDSTVKEIHVGGNAKVLVGTSDFQILSTPDNRMPHVTLDHTDMRLWFQNGGTLDSIINVVQKASAEAEELVSFLVTGGEVNSVDGKRGTLTEIGVDDQIYIDNVIYVTRGAGANIKLLGQLTVDPEWGFEYWDVKGSIGELKCLDGSYTQITSFYSYNNPVTDTSIIGQNVVIEAVRSEDERQQPYDTRYSENPNFSPCNLTVEATSSGSIYADIKPYFGYFIGQDIDTGGYYRLGTYDIKGELTVADGFVMDLSVGEGTYWTYITAEGVENEFFTHLFVSNEGGVIKLGNKSEFLASTIDDASAFLNQEGTNLDTSRTTTTPEGRNKINGTLTISSEGHATLTYTGDDTSMEGEDIRSSYTTRNQDFKIENAIVTVTDDVPDYFEDNVHSSTTISNELSGSSVINDKAESNGSLTLDNTKARGVDLELVYAKEGDIFITHKDEVTADTVRIAAERMVAAVKADSFTQQATNATLTVDTLLQAEGGLTESSVGTASKVKADVVLLDGATLDVSNALGKGGLDLAGSFTIQSGAMLSEDDMLAVGAMEIGDKYDLAFNVTSFNARMDELSMDLQNAIDASDLFGDQFWKGEYYVCYTGSGSLGQSTGNGSNVGTVYLYKATPEPTTGTLSLLALAALAARRRRKG